MKDNRERLIKYSPSNYATFVNPLATLHPLQSPSYLFHHLFHYLCVHLYLLHDRFYFLSVNVPRCTVYLQKHLPVLLCWKVPLILCTQSLGPCCPREQENIWYSLNVYETEGISAGSLKNILLSNWLYFIPNNSPIVHEVVLHQLTFRMHTILNY